MADEGLRIVNSVDNSQVKSSFADMRREIVNSAQTAQAEGKKIDNAIDRVALTAATASDQLKKKIYEASQTVNTLSAKIIEQKDVVREVQADVRKLGEEYKKALKNGSIGASGKLAEFNAEKKALEEEKAALFGLNQERSKAQLKVKELRGQMELLKKTSDEGAQAVEFLKRGLAAIGGFQALKGFTAQVIQTRGEFQQLEVAFTTMLGSAEKANALMMQLTKTAAVTPFDLKGVTDGAKQLLAYGVAADEVNDTLIHLGDIAAGLSLPLGDLVYLYGTTLTQGRMFTQDLRQFMGRGIPIAEELAKQFGVTKDKVQELVSTGKVGADEFKQAIMAMSSEGGKFGGLMEEQSKTITGQISNIEDAIDNAFNKIGKQSEGAINTALDGVSYLVENYEKVGKIILSVAGVYGTYKAAVLAVIAAEKIAAAARLAHIRQQTLLQLATDVLTKKMALLNTTMLMNPWVLAATAIAGLIAVMINLETEADRVREVNEEYNNTLDETIRKEEEHERRVNELIGIAGDEALSTDTRIEALQKLNNKYPQIFAKYKTEYEWLTHLRDIKAEIAELDGQTSHKKATVQKKDVDSRISQLEKKGRATYTTQTTSYGAAYTYQTGGRTAKEETELKELYKKREQLAKQIQKDKGDYYMTHLTGVSNEDLDAQIQQRQNLLAKMKIEGKKYGKTTTGGAQGTYTADELSAQLNNLNAEKNRRNEATYTPAQRKAQLASELASAKKALADFDKTSSKFTVSEAEAQRKKLQDAVSDAEKKYKAMGGDPDGKTARKEANEAKRLQKKSHERKKEEAKYQELLKQQKVERERAIKDIEFSTSQAQIDTMTDGQEKTLRQLRLNFRMEDEELRRGYEDLKRSKIEEAKKLFEANPANKDKVFDASKVNTAYTDDETNQYALQRKAIRSQYIQQVSEMNLPHLPESYIKDRIEAIKQEYATTIATIQEEETRLKESQNGTLTESQTQSFVEQYKSAQEQMAEEVKLLEDAEVARNTQRFQNLLEQYKGYDDRRRDIEQKFSEDMAVLNQELQNVQSQGGDTSSIQSTIQERTRVYHEEIQKLQSEIVQTSDFYTKLFGEASEKGYKVLRDFYKQAQETLDNAKVLSDGVEIEIVVKDADGKFIKKAVKVTVDEFQKMKKQVKSSQTELEKRNPFKAFQTSWKDMVKAFKEDGDVSGNVKKLNEKGKELTSTFKSWGDSLGSVFGDNFSKSIDEIMQMIDGVMDLGTGIAQIYSGDIVGGITSALSGISAIVSLFTGWEEKRKEMERQWYIGEIETNRAMRERNEEYAQMRSTISDIIRGEETLQWLIDKGYAKVNSASLWATMNDQLNTYKKNLSSSEKEYDNLRKKLATEGRGYYEWGNSLIGGSSEWSLNNATDAELELWYNQGKLNDAARQYYEAWKESGKSIEELRGKIEECYASMQEMVMGVNFDRFLSNARNALMDMRNGVKELGDFTEETLVEAIMNAFMYQYLADALEPLFTDLSKHMIEETADETYLSDWKKRFETTMNKANAELDKLEEITGVKIGDGSNYQQEASTKGFQAMSQDTGDELNGRFTAMVSLQAETKDLTALQNELLTQLNTCGTGIKTSVEALQTALATSNIHLSDIAKYTKELQGSKEILEEIRDNTKHL